MTRTAFLPLTASLAALLACSQGSPTAPPSSRSAAGASGVTSAEDPAPVVRAPGRPRVGVVAPRGGGELKPGMWGSNQVVLIVAPGTGRLNILAGMMGGGGCYGSYGDVPQPVAEGRFTLDGKFTQLMGVYPGKMEYAAQFAGIVDGDRLTMTVSIPAMGTMLGPYYLTYGVGANWTPCLYP